MKNLLRPLKLSMVEVEFISLIQIPIKFMSDPGGTWQGVDVHETSSEEIFVVSGTFKDGDCNYEAGTFIHYPLGSSHVPQSDTGCILFVFYPN